MDNLNFVEVDSAKIYTTIITELMNYCDEALYPGDERRIFGEALALVLTAVYNDVNDKCKQRMLEHARGTALDALGERQGVYRLSPASASASFLFKLSAAQGENIIIPKGTRITSDGSVYFATEELAMIPAGATEISVNGVCTEGGSAYNGFTVGSIATLVDLIPYVGSVSNTTETTGGDDGEPYTEEGDNNFRIRISLAPSAQSTAGPESAYRYYVLSADPDIIDVAIDCPEDEPNTVNLYPLMKGGALPDAETLQKVLEATNAADVRPMTDKVNAIAPEAVEYDIHLIYFCTQDNEAETIQSIEGEGGAIDLYNQWQTAALGRDINPDQLRRFLFAPPNGTGAIRADIAFPSFTKLGKNQIAKFTGNIEVFHEVTEE